MGAVFFVDIEITDKAEQNHSNSQNLFSLKQNKTQPMFFSIINLIHKKNVQAVFGIIICVDFYFYSDERLSWKKLHGGLVGITFQFNFPLWNYGVKSYGRNSLTLE